jgi:hypothetical protein
MPRSGSGRPATIWPGCGGCWPTPPDARLAIEIDGDTHNAPGQAAHDTHRTAWREERGYRVFRFQPTEVGRNLESPKRVPGRVPR